MTVLLVSNRNIAIRTGRQRTTLAGAAFSHHATVHARSGCSLRATGNNTLTSTSEVTHPRDLGLGVCFR